MTAAALYAGRVSHTRLKPVRHHLSYSVLMGLFDLDRLPELSSHGGLFGYNRVGLISFYDRDHGDGADAPLRPQIEARLRDAGIAPPRGAMRLLCMPRVFGSVFNPLSVYFCHDETGALRATVHEVNNTYGERHFYALPADTGANQRITQACDKVFRVSPLTPMQAHYQFSIAPPGEAANVSILMSDSAGPLLTASFKGERRAFTRDSLLRHGLLHAALTLKVIAGIRWEAALTWLKLRRAASAHAGPSARGVSKR